MTETQLLLTQILSSELFDKRMVLLKEVNWQSVLEEALQQAVFPAAFSFFKMNYPVLLKNPEYQKYAAMESLHYASAIRNAYDHNELHRLLASHEVSYVILKGQASAVYYPKPYLRSAGDVDFLVKIEDRQRVDRLLTEFGYKKTDIAEKHEFHWAYHKEKTSLEMHWDLPGVPRDDQLIRCYCSNIFEDVVHEKNQNGEFLVPSAFHHGLVLLLHTISHLSASGVGLRHLCDWLVFENSMTEKYFVNIFEKPLKEIGLWIFAQVLTKIGVMYFGCEEREWCREASESVCAAFLEDVFAGGNFGVKDSTRGSQAKLIRNNVSQKVIDGSISKNILISINEKAKYNYPVMKQIPILLPFGWIIICTQYLTRVILRKRNNVFNKTIMADAMNRQKLYSELKLFETV